MVAAPRDDAADLVQELSWRPSQGGPVRLGREAEAYVRRAVVSRSVDTSRRRASERRTLARLRPERPALDGTAVTGLAPSVEAALLALQPRVRACVVLRHLEDLSVRQTADLRH